jgi:transcriptional regulator with XRE-family HTH domain
VKLLNLMKDKGYSFRELAAATGVSLTTIERIVYGHAKMPHPKTKRLIAEFFKVRIEEIDEFKEPVVEPEN